MTRHARLMATLRGKPVDRPPVSFYEVGGFMVEPGNPDPYNIYNAPDWQPLLRLAEEHTDLILMVSPVRARSVDPTGSATSAAWRDFFREETTEHDGVRSTRTTLTVAGRTMTQTTKRERDLDTVWTTEHLLKDADDARAYLQISEEVFKETVDAKLFHRLLEKAAARIQARTREVSRLFPGRLWRIYGPEYASEPYLPPRLFEEYVVRYTGPMVRAIQAQGGYARIHSHGRLMNILDLIAGMGADALDPIEPPPQGDMTLREVRARHGRQLVLFGNLEIRDIERLPPAQFEEQVKRALDEGMSGAGRGFVLQPSASPYGRTISARTITNYETIIRLVETLK
ncbi:MAG: hypothetical protein NTY53_15270 [Kiritimatiellaeota bacterium]|nr:hypothetical protein [Kiritimatiellota bacterium]